eukprot:gene6667-7982_t
MTHHQTIPRIIHQTYESWEAIPACAREVLEENKRTNPGWQYCFYSNEAISKYIQQHESAHVWGAYQRIHPIVGAALADFFRYVVMYHTGGVYLDLKCRILKPLDSWVHSEMLQLSTMPHWEHKQLDRAFPSSVRPKSNRREITQVALVFPKQHPLMRKVIDRMVEVIYAGGNKDILHVTDLLHRYAAHCWLRDLHRELVAMYVLLRFRQIYVLSDTIIPR